MAEGITKVGRRGHFGDEVDGRRGALVSRLPRPRGARWIAAAALMLPGCSAVGPLQFGYDFARQTVTVSVPLKNPAQAGLSK